MFKEFAIAAAGTAATKNGGKITTTHLGLFHWEYLGCSNGAPLQQRSVKNPWIMFRD